MPLAIVRTATRQLRGADRLFDVCLENLEQTLAALAASHRALTAPQSGAFSSNSGGPRQLLRPDAASVRLATSRALGVGALSTAVWLACGGNAARHVLLGAGIFIVLAAAIDDSEPRTAWLLAGCFAGAAAALIWHTGFGPGAHVVWAWAALLAPLTVAAAALADRRTDGVGLAFTLTFAILMLPSHPALHAEPMHAVNAVAMLLTGIVSTHVAYRWLVPLAARRRQLLLRALRAEVAAIAAHADAPQRAMRHLARLRVHVLRLLSVVEDSGASDGALAILSLGHALLRMGALLQQRPDAAQAQCIRHALSIASRTHAAPHANAKALQGYAEELQASGDALPVARGLQDAASCLASCGSLFVNSSARCGGTPAFVLPHAEGSSAPHKRA